MDDTQLYAKWMEGDKGAGGELHARHGQSLIRWLRANARNVEDIAQATWLSAMAGGYRGEGSFQAWLRMVAKTKIRDEERARRRQSRVATRVAWVDEDDRTSGSRRVLRAEGQEALEELSERFRATTALWVAGEGLDSIAAATGAPRDTVRSRIRIARKKLRKRLHA